MANSLLNLCVTLTTFLHKIINFLLFSQKNNIKSLSTHNFMKKVTLQHNLHQNLQKNEKFYNFVLKTLKKINFYA